jgi:lipase maturation factor 1
VCFLSFIAAAQDFASYQSDGMLLEAGFVCLFLAPPGFWPGLGRKNPPTRAAYYMLLWEWFCIYFGSGLAKMLSGDRSWRNFTAMDDYYQNGPLPTWIGWYVSHLPHWFHAFAVFYTLAAELVLCWMVFLPRRVRITLFFILLPFQVSIILTANYAFLNYIVLFLQFLMLDDRFIEWAVPRPILQFIHTKLAQDREPAETSDAAQPSDTFRERLEPIRMSVTGICLGLIFYTTLAAQYPFLPLPGKPIQLLAPFRVADSYGLFAVMTHARYEIEFQGSNDGKDWTPYPFRYKPQDVKKAPGLYAPYQPRFDWNLWFASLGSWQQYRFVIWTEERLLHSDADVQQLFAGNPFASAPPKDVRAVIYQYWFTDLHTQRTTGNWWTRRVLGNYAPALERQPDGKILMIDTQPVGDLPQ